MLVGLLAVLLSSYGVFLGLFVFSLFVMVDSFAVMMCRRFVMPGRGMVRFACGMFHGHDLRRFKGSNREEVFTARPPENVKSTPTSPQKPRVSPFIGECFILCRASKCTRFCLRAVTNPCVPMSPAF